MVSTVGVFGGDFGLKLGKHSGAIRQSALSAKVSDTYNDGSIHIVPEPGTLILLASLLTLLPVVVLRRKRLA